MLFILLDDVLGVGIELQDFLIVTTSQKDVLFTIRRVKFDAGWHTFVGEAMNDFTIFGVPELDALVVACAQETASIVLKANVAN
tara:strand:+ start:256 stop:507 length:252 start_codon:yes stop_codon:yes gene_type:complete